MDAALLRRVEEQRVAMLYGNTAAVSGSAVLMAALVVIIAWPQTSGLRIFGWCCAVLLVQAAVQWLTFAYRRSATAQAEPRMWGMRLAHVAIVAGMVWGSAAFVLVGAGQSLTLALIAACLASRTTITIMTHAYFPPALHGFAVPIFGLLAVRYAIEGGYRNAALGVLWIAVLGYVLLFVERQARVVTTQIRLRCENEQLVDELKRQNVIAEQARVRAEEASRSKSRFFAAANHDLRQPLHSLGLFATALRNGSIDEPGRKLIDQILLCTESLEQLFDNLLDISRLDAGQVEVKRETVPVNAVLERVRRTFTVPADEKGLKLHVRRSRLLLDTDATLLFRMLSNLVSNAIRYTDKGGVLVALPQAWFQSLCRSVGYRHGNSAGTAGTGVRRVLPAEQSGTRSHPRPGSRPGHGQTHCNSD